MQLIISLKKHVQINTHIADEIRILINNVIMYY